MTNTAKHFSRLSMMADPKPSKPKVQTRNVFQSFAGAFIYSFSCSCCSLLYVALPAATRRTLAVGAFAFAGIGLFISDYLEKKLPADNQ